MDIDVSRLEGGEKKFEELCPDLIIRIYPDIKQIDGSGGDGGVDSFYGMLNETPVVFQYKFFPGRLSESNRKKKIIDSLETAIKKNPRMKEWTLLIPINFTSEEQKWFETELINKHQQIKIDYWNKQRINNEISKNNEVLQRYFPTASMAIVKRVEKAVPWMFDPPVNRIFSHAEEMRNIQKDNPHLNLTYSVDSKRTNINISPKQPIGFGFTLRGATELSNIRTNQELIERLKQGNIVIGEDSIVEVNFKNKDFLNMPPEFKMREITILKPEPRIPIMFEVPNTNILFENVWIQKEHINSEIKFNIDGLPIKIKMHLPDKDKTIRFDFSARIHGKPIYKAKQIISLIDSIAKNGITIRDNTGKPVLSNAKIINITNGVFPEFIRELVDRLNMIEQKTGVGFVFESISEKEWEDLLLASELITTERKEMNIEDLSLTFRKEGLDIVKLEKGSVEGMTLEVKDHVVKILGKNVPIGNVRYSFPTLEVINLEEVQEQLKSSAESVKVRFKPAVRGEVAIATRISEEHRLKQDNIENLGVPEKTQKEGSD